MAYKNPSFVPLPADYTGYTHRPDQVIPNFKARAEVMLSHVSKCRDLQVPHILRIPPNDCKRASQDRKEQRLGPTPTKLEKLGVQIDAEEGESKPLGRRIIIPQAMPDTPSSSDEEDNGPQKHAKFL
jgi:hypothetical protein